MRLIMVGTGPFAVPTFRGLYETGHEIAALVTAPLRLRHGKSVAPISTIRDVANEHGTPILAPERINDKEVQTQLEVLDVDLQIVCDYGQILSAATLAIARLGGINLHGSLLPKYRGAAPVNWAIYNGETESGVTVIHMTPLVDTGPCIAQERVPIEPDETARELRDRLAKIGDGLIRRTIESLREGAVEALPQDPTLASRAPKLKKKDGLINWERTATEIKNHIRAFEPWPKTFTFWRQANGKLLRLLPDRVRVAGQNAAGVAPGTVVEAGGDQLMVATGSGVLAFQNIQPAGKKLLTTHEFLRGYRVRAGDRFGAELDSQ